MPSSLHLPGLGKHVSGYVEANDRVLAARVALEEPAGAERYVQDHAPARHTADQRLHDPLLAAPLQTARPALEVQRWLRYAREDLMAAEAMFGQQSVAPRHICWLAQQGAEKALKAGLVFLQIDFPRRHDLDAIRNLFPTGWWVKEAYPDLSELTEWAVEARYPGEWPEATEADADAALQQARGIWTSICADFGRHGFRVESDVERDAQEPPQV